MSSSTWLPLALSHPLLLCRDNDLAHPLSAFKFLLPHLDSLKNLVGLPLGQGKVFLTLHFSPHASDPHWPALSHHRTYFYKGISKIKDGLRKLKLRGVSPAVGKVRGATSKVLYR